MTQRMIATAAPALLCAALAAGTATANFDMYYLSATNWGVKVFRMPDLDQKRNTLPGNGNMYCVPTAAVNAYAYVAHHGYPDVTMPDHGWVWWAVPDNYAATTGHLALTGFIMGTDPGNGTTGGGGMNGFVQMQGGADDDLIVMHFQTDKDYFALAFDDLAGWARAGAIVVPIVGWYPDTPVTNRNGGHAVTLAGAWRLGPDRVIAFRDPATGEGGINEQSPFATSVYNVGQTLVEIITGYGPVTRVMDQIAGMSSGDTLALLDGFYVIFPPAGYTTSNDGFGLVRLRPNSWSWDNAQIVEQVETAVRQIRDIVIDPATARALFLTEADSDFPTLIWRYDPVTDSSGLIIGRVGIIDMEISRTRRVYVRTATHVYCYSIIGSGAATETASAALPAAMSAMSYDDVTDRLYFLNTANSSIYPFDPDLVALPTVQVPAGSGLVGAATMAASPVDGSLWLTSIFGSKLVRLDPTRPVGIMNVYSLPAGVLFPASVNVTNSGRIHLTSGGVIKVLELSPQDTLVNIPGALFAGLAAPGPLHLPHNRTNHDPAVMETSEYFNVLPTVFDPGVADCLADLDGANGLPDGTVGILDFLALLAAWGPCPGDVGCDGDITGTGGPSDGTVGILDFLDLLAKWGPCGQLPLVP